MTAAAAWPMANCPTTPGLYGRSGELRVVDALLRKAGGGESAALVVRGGPGVGKTTLLEYAVAEASGMRVDRVAGTESEMELPYSGLHQLCAPMLDRLDRLPAPQRDALGVALGLTEGDVPDRFLVALAVLTLLGGVAEEQPLLCVIDDAQWLDHASLQALAFAARRVLADRIAIIFAVREPSEEGFLAGLDELTVSPLSDRDARMLLSTAMPGPLDSRVRERIIAEAQGNPLALLQLPMGMTPAQLAGGYGLTGSGPVESRIERSYLTQLRLLPERTQRLLLVAAADPKGDAPLLWKAAERLGLETDMAAPAEAAGLITIDTHVRFRHPLVRSAVYRTAPMQQRRAVHRALAEVTDPDTDPDHKAWHRAHAAAQPDEEVATALERSADRACARGGVAASAAFLAYAADLTPEPAIRAGRALSAAEGMWEAGAPAETLRLLAIAEALPLTQLQRAHVDLLQARIASAGQRGRDVAQLLITAADRLRALDAPLARETYLEAVSVAVFTGRLADGGDAVRTAAQAALDAPAAADPPRALDLLLDALAIRFLQDYTAAVPAMQRAVRAFRDEDAEGRGPMRWYDLAGRVALDLWDSESFHLLGIRQVELLRDAGSLTALPHALAYCAGVFVKTGRLSGAAHLLEESDAITGATGAPRPQYIEPLITAYRGQQEATLEQVDAITRSATAQGNGRTVSLVQYAAAVLHNGLSQFPAALAATQLAAEHDDLGMHNYALLEMVEAAVRSGRTDLAHDAAHQLAARGDATATSLGRGIAARSLALIGDGPEAEAHYRQAVEHLGRSGDLTELGRAHLLYGEWLRRENRSAVAREHLRIAQEIFASMGAHAFADRARHELVAVGDREVDAASEPRETADPSITAADAVADSLTAQESAVAHLARDGYTNSEIATQLFISPRTVEWHLSKIFNKLDITSRRQLRTVLGAARTLTI